MNYVPYRTPPTAGLKPWLPPIAATALLWWVSANPISAREFAMATLLLLLPWYSYCRWQKEGRLRLPLFALLGLAYWAAFAMPLFLADPATDPQTGDTFKEPVLFAVMTMTVLGVGAMGLGMNIPFLPFNPAMMPDVRESRGTSRYLYCIMWMGTILSIKEEWILTLGSGGHQVLEILSSTVPLAVFGTLGAKLIRHEASPSDRYCFAIFIAARILIGIASGWLGSVVIVGLLISMIYISFHRRLPTRAILIVIPALLFLQAGKEAFRTRYWTGESSGNVVEKAMYWLEASADEWTSVFRHGDKSGSHRLLSKTTDRVALLRQAANVLSKTPGVVPFQHGTSYTYLAASLIPRAVWPDKPSVNEANRFYQVAYGLTNKEDLEGVSIAVGCLVESYMNFGWWGVVGIMFAIGLVLGVFERTLFAPDSGFLFFGLGIGLLGGLIAIEGQVAQYLGGMIQQIGLVFVVMLPVIRRRKTRHPQPVSVAEAV